VPAALHVYRLCEHCLRRQGEGAGGFEAVRGGECFVCGGLMDAVPSLARKAVRAARPYEFGTFTVGVSLPEGVQEKEDELRSDFKLKGYETVKTQAAKLIAGLVSEGLGKRVDKLRPDLTLLVDMRNGEVAATSRPVYFYGRYTKPSGASQRREMCRRCSGAGCKKCGKTGFERRPSVEAELRRKLGGFTGSERMTFTWLGSEDRGSRVYPPGRPFVAEVKSPVKRKVPRRFAARFKGGQVEVSSGRVLPSKPMKLPGFRFRTEIVGVAKSKVSAEGLAELRKRFRGAEVRFERPYDRPTTKTVYRASAKARGRTLVIDAELDGGLPVKRFVSGELVSPSVSEVLKTEVRCRTFDICGVRETGEFEFAEVARKQTKN
jgi:tRNA pseudouridine synthase 10